MDIGSLMWDETGRDYDQERAELSRTAALTDVDRLVGEFVYRAGNDVDLVHRLALVDPQLQAIATQRMYPVGELTGDITRRWQMLSQARTAAARQKTAARKVTAAAEQAMDAVTARLATLAARENPSVPMAECLKLAAEAVRVHADAYPLAYESWGGTGDGPFTDRAKHWQPPEPKGNNGKAVDPGPNGGASTYDSVHKKLDDLENRLNGASAPSAPSGSTTAALDPVTAGMWQRLKDWWGGPSSSPAPAAPEERAPYMTPSNNAASDHVDSVTERMHDQQGRREFDEIMRRLDSEQAEMNHKWDTPREDRFESPADTNQRTKYLQDVHDRRSDDMEQRLDSLGDSLKPTPPSTPAGGFSHADRPQITNVPLDHPSPATFSHTDTGTGGGQQMLPTDPAEHAFSHRTSSQHSLFE